MKTKRNRYLPHIFSASLFITLLIIATSCQQQSKGFVLPEGTVEQGRIAFQKLSCDNCHSIDNIAWSGSEELGDPHIKLGGEITKIKTYGELVTSIINPSHKISKTFVTEQELTLADGSSKMALYSYNHVMSVQELVDIVTFLQSEYKLVTPDSPYPYYGG